MVMNKFLIKKVWTSNITIMQLKTMQEDNNRNIIFAAIANRKPRRTHVQRGKSKNHFWSRSSMDRIEVS